MSELNKELAVEVALKVIEKVEIKKGPSTYSLNLDSINAIIKGVYKTLESLDNDV